MRNKLSLVSPMMLPLPTSHFTVLKDEQEVQPTFLKWNNLLFIDSSRREIFFSFFKYFVAFGSTQLAHPSAVKVAVEEFCYWNNKQIPV